MKTQDEIQRIMRKMEAWGLFSAISVNDRKTIEQDLRFLAGTAIMEANDKIQHVLPQFYNEIKQQIK